jgi:antitoxin component YwqK of YwqJK toxin-antitoxin module
MKIHFWFTCIFLLTMLSCRRSEMGDNTYYPDGKLWKKTIYISPDDKSEYRIYEYDKNGGLISLTEYKDKIPDGRSFSYYSNGEIKSVFYYSIGRLTSVGRYFNDKGMLTDKGLFINDSMVVKEEFFYKDNLQKVNVFSKRKDDFPQVGRLMYNSSNTSFGLDNSFYYIASSVDSIQTDDSIRVDVNFIARRKGNPYITLSLGVLDENLNFTQKDRTLTSDSLYLSFYYKPSHTGYNLILGKLYFIVTTPKEEVNEFIFYHDFLAY